MAKVIVLFLKLGYSVFQCLHVKGIWRLYEHKAYILSNGFIFT